jgi:hypothetical protein
MAQINKGTTYAVGNATVTIDNLNAHVANATLLVGAITEQTSIVSAQINSLSNAQVILETGNQLRKSTLSQAVTGALSGTTNGQLLIGNTSTSQFSKANLTAGSGIVVTNGPASISVATVPFASYASSTISGPQTATLAALSSFSGYFKYTLLDAANLTVKLPGASKNGALFQFNVTFSGTGTINFQASGSVTNITSSTLSVTERTYTFIALQDNPTQAVHWAFVN